MHRRGLPTCWDVSPAGRRTIQSVWQRHLLQSWWSLPHYDVTEIRAAMHTYLRMMQKYFMIQRMCSRVMAKNIFNKKSILHSDNGGYQSFDIVVWILLLFYHGYIWESIEIRGNVSIHVLEKNAIQPELFCTLPSFAWKLQMKSSMDKMCGHIVVQGAGECSQVW